MKSRIRVLCLSFSALFALVSSAALAVNPVFTVTSTGDEADDNPGNGICHTAANTCTLRAAIQEANAAPASQIHFNVSGTGCSGSPATCSIQPADVLPILIKPVTIDGYTQPGASPNTNGPSLGTNAVLRIEIDGTHTAAPGSNSSGVLVFNNGSNGSIVRGLAINRAVETTVAAIHLANSGSNTVEGCFLGTDPTGTVALPNYDGVRIIVGTNNIIGGTTPAARNVLSGNSGYGFDIDAIFLTSTTGHLVAGNLIGTNAAGTGALGNFDGVRIGDSGSSNTFGGLTTAARNVISGNRGRGINMGVSNTPLVSGNLILGNYIGVDVTGTIALGNGGTSGVAIAGFSNTVGGSASGAGNVISGNAGIGIELFGSDNTIVQGNMIGTDPGGTLPLGNGNSGVSVVTQNSQIGGTAAGAGNVIAFNGKPNTFGGGVLLFGNTTGNRVFGNSIYSNRGSQGGLGIDLGSGSGANNVTPNDIGDADSGANLLQNFPIITSASAGASSGTRIQGLLQSAPSTAYRLEFFTAESCLPRPHGFVSGKTFLGFSNVTTSGTGDFLIDVTLPVPFTAGERVTATATDPAFNTSEFAQRTVLSVSPVAGTSAGGTSVTINGMQFLPGATTVTIGGVPATNVTYVSQYQLTATTPARTPGQVFDVTVTNPAPSPLFGTLTNGWVADFLDVPSTSSFEPFVAKLVANTITAGCQNGNYCPGDPVTRAQMAVFLLRSNFGVCYLPPPATGTVFTDVPANSFAAAYVEALAAAQVTSGCGGSNYCPSSPVTRAQMAVFLLRMLEGPTYTPPACTTATFNDVPCSSGFAPWIYELVNRNITVGCGGGSYCPNSTVSRGQMAVFLTATFNLP